MGRGRPLFSTPEKQRQYQMVRFDRLPKAMRDKVNYADKQYYITADGMLTYWDACGRGALDRPIRMQSSVT
jgi:hypothetical protein